MRKSPDVWLIGLFDSEPHLLPEFRLSTCPSLSHVHFPSSSLFLLAEQVGIAAGALGLQGSP